MIDVIAPIGSQFVGGRLVPSLQVPAKVRACHALVPYVAVALAALSTAGCGQSGSPANDGGQSCVDTQTFKTAANPRLDVLFVVDDSPAMAGMQAKLAKVAPSLVTAFYNSARGGYPDLHVAVVTSSLGGGRFANVPGCELGSAGARDGAFVHPAGAGLAGGETFMRFNGTPLNVKGDPGAVFGALAAVGTGGCVYPQPLQAALRALTRAQDPADPDNGGFLRANARLLVVVVTDQDDCSIPADSDLFDPSQTSVADPYGAPGIYRCAEFGWSCIGGPPPHMPNPIDNPIDIALPACVPAENYGRLTPVATLSAALRAFKHDPDEVSVSLISGAAGMVVVGQQVVDPGTGVPEAEPRLQPACTGPDGESATPAVRLKAWADTFAANGIFIPVCTEDDQLATVVSAQLNQINSAYGSSCLDGVPILTEAGQPNCQVTQTSVDEAGTEVRWALPYCDPDRTVLPCWKMDVDALQCIDTGPAFTVCRDPACTSAPSLTPAGSVTLRCQVGC